MPNVNKAEWIRSLPASMSAAEVVRKGKAAGIKVSIAQVYNTRSLAKKRVTKRPTKPGRKPNPSSKIAATKAGALSDGSHETLFRKIVVMIGRARAQAILNELSSIGL